MGKPSSHQREFWLKREERTQLFIAASEIKEARISTSTVTTFASTALAPGPSPENAGGWSSICRLEGVPDLTCCQIWALLNVTFTVSSWEYHRSIFNNIGGKNYKEAIRLSSNPGTICKSQWRGRDLEDLQSSKVFIINVPVADLMDCL